MIDPRLAWFAMGVLCGAVLFGWPWHPRFSRYSRRGSNPTPPAPLGIPWDEGHTQRGNGSGGPATSKPPIKPYSSAAIAWQAEDAQRIYRGAMWREKESDAWHSLGKPIDFTELARQQLNRTTPPNTP